MTPNEINEAIARSLGYRLEPRPHAGGWWIAPNNNASMSPPDYYSSLDACAEFESSLSKESKFNHKTGSRIIPEYIEYTNDLMDLFAEDDEFYNYKRSLAVSATSAQRCECYLKLKGLWK